MGGPTSATDNPMKRSLDKPTEKESTRKRKKKKSKLRDDRYEKKASKQHDERREDEERIKKKKRKKDKKKKKEKKRETRVSEQGMKGKESKNTSERIEQKTVDSREHQDNRIVESSALDFIAQTQPKHASENGISLLLFYQYVEPPWDSEFYNRTVLRHMERLGTKLKLTGRMRVAKEGLNCTLTGAHESILCYCRDLRNFHKGEFTNTEFKITRDLPRAQAFPSLKVMPVTELVNYGLDGEKAPSIMKTGEHLEPFAYHQKMTEKDTVVIDVRNHYEAAIGHFVPPAEGAKWLDPKMRKSTEFPVWLNKPETKEQLRGKQVLMYCTGGVRCERASALLNYKIETEPDIKELGIKGVFQLQGGIDKYFKEIPDGGYWKGKNYVFDKRFSHKPPKVEADERSGTVEDEHRMGKCEACGKPWDMYRGKRRCPTCGVPSLICRECLDCAGSRPVRCGLCVKQNITSKAQLKEKEDAELREYELARSKAVTGTASTLKLAPNPYGVTRLLLRNMCRRNMDERTLTDTLPGITNIVWRTDRKTGQFFGSAWVEMATADDAARAVGMNGKRVLGRSLYIAFDPPDAKDAWPPASSAVTT